MAVSVKVQMIVREVAPKSSVPKTVFKFSCAKVFYVQM